MYRVGVHLYALARVVVPAIRATVVQAPADRLEGRGDMKDDDTKDILDLCRLNLMEEHIEQGPATKEKGDTLKVIKFRRHRLAERITAKAIKKESS